MKEFTDDFVHIEEFDLITKLLKVLDGKITKRDAIKGAVRILLSAIGENLEREGLKGTPRRVADMYCDEILSGYTDDSELDVQFTEESNIIYTKPPIKFYSLCEHHMLPFYGNVWIAYIPRKKVTGASKLTRLVRKYSQRLQVQERMANQIADELWDKLEPMGVFVIVEGKHFCMEMRGVKTTSGYGTSVCKGVFLWNPSSKDEALKLMKGED